METNDLSGVLKNRTAPLHDASLSDILDKISEVATNPETISFLGDNYSFPISFVNGLGFKVNLYGHVPQDSSEYLNGARFFDSDLHLYDSEGCCYEGKTSLNLGDKLKLSSSVVGTRSSFLRPWVHPNHRDVGFLFEEFDVHRDIIKVNTTYLNRMGFVVEISGDGYSRNSRQFRDTMGVIYQFNGQIDLDKKSVYDIVLEIKNVDMFNRSNWSTDRQSASYGSDDDVPEMFDPQAEDKSEMLGLFYAAMLRANELSKKIGMRFSFSILDFTSTK